MRKPIRLNLTRILVLMSKSLLHGVILTCLFSGVLLANEGNAQHKSINEVFISLELRQVTVGEALQKIQEHTEFKFIYEQDVLSATREYRVTLEADNESVAEVLKVISDDTKLSFRQMNGSIVVKAPPLVKEVEMPKEREPALEQNISGKVTDENGEPLPGASVLVKDTSIGVITDVDGNYQLSAPDEATMLVFSYVGYAQQEVLIGGRTVIDITLTLDITELGEVVVSTGYWETDKRESTGNIAKITSEEIEKQPVSNPLQALQGRMAGVNIVQQTGLPGGGFFIQIRGRNSLRNFADDPLYLIDGVPFTASSLSTFNISRANSVINPLSSINPADIESIEVLKDADATAIYGTRGANGVILITTKQGTPGKTNLSVNFSTGFSKVANKTDLLNTEKYLEMRREALVNDGFDPVPPGLERFLPDLFAWDTTRYTDWQEELIGETANVTNAQVSLSGGNSNTQFLFSGSYYKETFVYPGDFNYQKGSGHINLNHKSNDRKFNLSLSTTFTLDKNNQPQIDFTRQALTLAPNAPAIYDSNGSLNWENSTWNNPFSELERKSEALTNNMVNNAVVSYRPIPDLEIKGKLGYTILRMEEISITPSSSINPTSNMTSGSIFSDSKINTWIVEPLVTYKKEIGAGNFTALIGATFQENVRKGETFRAEGFASDALLENPASASSSAITSSDYTQYRYNALFGRLNYNWKQKYIINLTGRRDGSSRFGPGKQFSNFGAVGAAWIFSNEDFILNSLTFLNFGKLRASYGTTGSDILGDYQFLDTYRNTFFPYQSNPGLVPARLFNADFAWELVKKLEVAIELGFMKERIFFTASWYRNRSSNQLIGLPLSLVTGFPSVQANFPATVENRGWELELNTTNIKTSNFEWTTSINFTIPRNELLEFSNIETTSFDNQFEVGRSLFTRFGPSYAGVDSETGTYTFEDLNQDGNPSFQPSFPDDFKHVGEIAPKYFGGFQSNLLFKGLKIDFLFQFVKQTGRSYLHLFSMPGSNQSNQPTIVIDRWQKPGDVTDIPRFSIINDNPIYSNVKNSDHVIVDASFIRLKNVSLSYRLPSEWMEKTKLKNTQIYIQGQNLLTFTDYPVLDPENTSFLALPPLRTVTAGIQFSL